ncbi:MAG: ribonuclease HI family protein [Candidatus Woykebacteria bacterium]
MEASKLPITFTIYTDGGSRGNPGPAASACVVKDSAGKVRVISGKYLGRATNNYAEYQGVVLAYEELAKMPSIDTTTLIIKFNLDSKLVVNQLNGLFKIKDPAIREAVVKIKGLENMFSQVSYTYIPREKNTFADRIVNETLDQSTKFKS